VTLGRCTCPDDLIALFVDCFLLFGVDRDDRLIGLVFYGASAQKDSKTCVILPGAENRNSQLTTADHTQYIFIT
jgi:hypothetical protein